MISTPPPRTELDRDATVIAHVVALVHSRRKGDYLSAADAHRELERLGVLVKFPRPGKGAAHAH